MTSFDRTTLDRIARSQPAWRAEQMAQAMASFDALPVPTGTEEEWRYVDLDLELDRLHPALDPGDSLEDGPFLTAAMEQASGRVTIVDGTVAGVDIASPGLAARRIADLDGLSAAAAADRDKFAAAHLAFATDGIRIEVPEGTVVETPVVVDVQATSAETMSFPHVEFAVGTNAEASMLVVYRSPDGIEAVSVPSVSLEADDGGRLRYLAVQRWGDATAGLAHQRLRLGRDATGRIGEVGLGGRVGRLDLTVDLEGSGSSSEVVGLYFGKDAQTLDYRVVIHHVGKSTSSDVYLKGAVEDDARSVFTGTIRIEKEANGASSFEKNRNLVLSGNAKAHSVPNLEILCNDVICGHGSSVGQLEEEHLYYLQSRGLSRQRAERMLIRGFFAEVVGRLPVTTVAGPIQDAVFSRFIEAQESGRLS